MILDTEAQRQHRIDGSPEAWAWTTAREVCIKIQDGTHFSPKDQVSRGKYPYVTAKNIRPTGLDLSNLTYLRESDHRAIYQRCDPKKGDVLLVKDGVNTGDAAINTLDEEISLLSSVCLLRAHPSILSSDFLRYFLLSPTGAELLKGKMTGTAIKRIVLGHIKELPVPVAPVAEQERIVAEIEKQFTRLDAAVKALKYARVNLTRYRASVLNAACEGRLVPTEAELARAAGRDYEPADVLLQRILKERRAKSEALQPRGDGKGHRGWSMHRNAVDSDAPHFGQLPEGWSSSIVDHISDLVTKGSSPNWQGFNYCDAGIVFVRSQNVGWGRLTLSDVAHLPESFNRKEKKSILQAGDVLLNIVGASIGRAAVASKAVAGGNVNQAVAVVRPIRSAVSSAFLVNYLISSTAQARIHLDKVDVARANLSLADIRSLPVPLPPFAEQQRIVAEVERRLSVIEEIKGLVEANLKRSERLRQSILKRAFEGKLVPQDANDEPASILLERIRAERKAREEGAASREGGNRIKRKRA